MVYMSKKDIGHNSCLLSLALTTVGAFFMRKIMFDYTSEKWRHKAEHIKRRDNYMCVRCKRYGKMRPAQIVHHIKHVDEYPELAYEDSNLESLCVSCHNKMHPEKGRKGLYGRYKR